MDALDEYVKELRLSKGEGVPDFSINDGRTEAKVLFLHRDPGKSGASKTGRVDRDNPYITAKNFREANEKAGLDRKLTIAWSAVASGREYVCSGTKKSSVGGVARQTVGIARAGEGRSPAG